MGSYTDIEQQARALKAEERAMLAENLLESLMSPISEVESAWAKEIEKRIIDFEQGRSKVYEAAEVFAEAHRLTR